MYLRRVWHRSYVEHRLPIIYFYFMKCWNAEYANNFAAHHNNGKGKVEKWIKKKTEEVVTQFKQTGNELEWEW